MKGKIIYYSIFITIAFTISSCNWWSGIWGNHSLGNHLSLWEGDTKEDRTIAYCTSQSFGACVSGIYVVPNEKRHMIDGKYAEYVKTAASNKKWVLVKTYQIQEKKENYWIISKDFDITNLNCSTDNCDSILQSHVTGPLDSLDFYSFLKARNIDLKFKEREK